MKVYLVDKEENVQTELFPSTEYSFNTKTATSNNESRFSLLFRAPGTSTATAEVQKNNIQVYVNADNQITITAPLNSKYAIYNSMGQLIHNGVIAFKQNTIYDTLIQGVYIVKVNNVSNRVILK